MKINWQEKQNVNCYTILTPIEQEPLCFQNRHVNLIASLLF